MNALYRIARAEALKWLLPLALTLPAAHAADPAARPADKDQPLWELGAGVAALTFPAYRGSDQQTNFLLPVPYFTYHGKILKADRKGLRGELFGSDRLELSVSAALSPPVTSKDITARAGMPDLKATAELGPELDITLWRSTSRARELKLQLPIRAAYTLERSPTYIGWVSHPRLNLDITDLPGLPEWNLGLQAGALFGDQRQHAYYYSVAPADATATRPAYAADAGYAGAQFLAAVSKRFDKMWFGAFVRYDNLSGATFADSPLVKSKNYFAGGFALSWIFDESSTRVPVED